MDLSVIQTLLKKKHFEHVAFSKCSQDLKVASYWWFQPITLVWNYGAFVLIYFNMPFQNRALINHRTFKFQPSAHGLRKGNPWIIHGSPMGSPWEDPRIPLSGTAWASSKPLSLGEVPLVAIWGTLGWCVAGFEPQNASIRAWSFVTADAEGGWVIHVACLGRLCLFGRPGPQECANVA